MKRKKEIDLFKEAFSIPRKQLKGIPIYLRDLHFEMQKDVLSGEFEIQRAYEEGKEIIVGYFIDKPKIEE